MEQDHRANAVRLKGEGLPDYGVNSERDGLSHDVRRWVVADLDLANLTDLVVYQKATYSNSKNMPGPSFIELLGAVLFYIIPVILAFVIAYFVIKKAIKQALRELKEEE